MWTSVNERDEIGNDLVPDYMTSVRDGGFYGWLWSYYGQTVDKRLKPPRLLVADDVGNKVWREGAAGSQPLPPKVASR